MDDGHWARYVHRQRQLGRRRIRKHTSTTTNQAYGRRDSRISTSNFMALGVAEAGHLDPIQQRGAFVMVEGLGQVANSTYRLCTGCAIETALGGQEIPCSE
jgi:hypothetical protein